MLNSEMQERLKLSCRAKLKGSKEEGTRCTHTPYKGGETSGGGYL